MATEPIRALHTESLNPCKMAPEHVVINVHALHGPHWSITLSSTT
jgi:hypothetical protein